MRNNAQDIRSYSMKDNGMDGMAVDAEVLEAALTQLADEPGVSVTPVSATPNPVMVDDVVIDEAIYQFENDLEMSAEADEAMIAVLMDSSVDVDSGEAVDLADAAIPQDIDDQDSDSNTTAEMTDQAKNSASNLQQNDSAVKDAQTVDGDQTTAVHTKRGVQKRIDELTRDKHEARRRELEAIRREEALRALIFEFGDKGAVSDEVPQMERFEEYDDYVQAVALHDELVEAAKMRDSQRADVLHSFRDRMEAARSRYSDFDDVALAPSLPVTQAMQASILGSEKGPEIAYWLGNHRDEAARIAELSPMDAARELGRVELLLEQPERNTITKAPEPIAPMGVREQVIPDPSNMSMAEYRSYRQQR